MTNNFFQNFWFSVSWKSTFKLLHLQPLKWGVNKLHANYFTISKKR